MERPYFTLLLTSERNQHQKDVSLEDAAIYYILPHSANFQMHLGHFPQPENISCICRHFQQSFLLFFLLQDGGSSSGTDMSICKSEALFSSLKVTISIFS
jgi:hypothetical protein